MSTSTVSVLGVLKAATDSAHHILEQTMADVTDEVANRPAPGKANPIGSSYAHTVIGEDVIVHGMLQGKAPLCASTWAGRTGVDKAMPMPGMVEGDLGEWYRTVRVDVAACREYTKAVYAATDAFLASADEATLAREVDMSMIGMGTMPLAVMFAIVVIGHCNSLCGEISAIKGASGLKGYPF